MAAGEVNRLLRSDWSKYGINPWNIDTDYDGYADEWEIKNGFCPTNPAAVSVRNSECKKGSFDLRAKKYIAPAAVKAVAPRGIKMFASCAALDKKLKDDTDHYQTEVEMAENDNALQSLLSQPLNKVPNTVAAIFFENYLQYATLNDVELKNENLLVSYRDHNYYFLRTSGKGAVFTRTNNGNWRAFQEISLPDSTADVENIGISGNNLFVYTRKYTSNKVDWYETRLYIYSLANPAGPVLKRTVVLNGSVKDSLAKNGYLYLALVGGATNFETTDKSSDFLPFTYKDKIGTGKETKINLKQCNEVEYVGRILGSRYLSLVSVPLNGGKVINRTILGSTESPIFEGDSLYLLSLNFNDRSVAEFLNDPAAKTEIYKFNLAGGKFILDSSNTVPGVIANYGALQFSGGNLAVVSSRPNNHNERSASLFTFDSHLNKLGWYENAVTNALVGGLEYKDKIAKVKLQGAILYATEKGSVIFNLANPHTPFSFGQFSYPDYVQKTVPLKKDFVLGFGSNASYTTSTPGFNPDEGIKLGWFNLANHYIPNALAELSLGKKNSWLGNYPDDIIASSDGKYIAFYATVWDSDSTTTTSETFDGIMIYRFNEAAGFVLTGSIPRDDIGHTIDKITVIKDHLAIFGRNYEYAYNYDGTTYVQKNVVQLYDFSTAEKKAELVLNK